MVAHEIINISIRRIYTNVAVFFYDQEIFDPSTISTTSTIFPTAHSNAHKDINYLIVINPLDVADCFGRPSEDEKKTEKSFRHEKSEISSFV